MEIRTIQIKDLFRDEEQPRKFFDEEALSRLTQSIKDNGIEQPITVRKNGKGFIIIDGERRWRASKNAGLNEIPCIVTVKDDILEQQLRSDCLKEGLTVDELDKAIYRYYESMRLTSETHKKANKNTDSLKVHVSKAIGKSYNRVDKAIDRFEFKRDNAEFTKNIEQKHNPENKKFSKVNSTIAMTVKLKDKPEVRKAVIEEVLKAEKGKDRPINNDKIKQKIDYIANNKHIETADDARMTIQNMIESEKSTDIKKDPRHIFTELFFEFGAFIDKFEKYHFEHKDVKPTIQGKRLSEFIETAEVFYQTIKNLEVKE